MGQHEDVNLFITGVRWRSKDRFQHFKRTERLLSIHFLGHLFHFLNVLVRSIKVNFMQREIIRGTNVERCHLLGFDGILQVRHRLSLFDVDYKSRFAVGYDAEHLV